MKYGVEFHFFSPSQIHLGFSYLEGVIHEDESDSNYREIRFGFLLFYIEFTTRERV